VRANDAIAGLVLIVLSAVMIALTASFPEFPGQKYGPSLFPRILGAGLVVCGAILIWNGLAARRAGAAWMTIAPWVRQPRRVATFLLVIALLLLYIFAAETVGFIPFALLFLSVLFLWLGVRPWIAAVTALASTLSVYWFFATMLRVPLPRGWLNSIL
jgi:putative tricarboxylic transport membrane protein